MRDLSITYRDPRQLVRAPVNPRTHSPRQIEQIVQSIRSFGFNNPVLLDNGNQIIAGHGRVAAALVLDMTMVPTVRLDHLTPSQKRAYVIADNRLAELAGWDSDVLAIELEGLMELDLEFEIGDIGFETPEIDLLLEARRVEDATEQADNLSELENLPATARLGDLWKLGDHLLFCGDALDRYSYRTLLGDEKAEMVFTDPPYNVPINGHVSGLGKARHDEFVMASGEMSAAQFTTFLRTAATLAASMSIDGAIHFICMDWRHLEELFAATLGIYSERKNLCVWVKTSGGMGSLYRSQHELVGVFKVGRAKHINNVALGRHGRNRTNVWTYPGMNSFQHGREAGLDMHPTLKPVALVRDAIYDCSSRGGLILDVFGGAGTTLIAAEQTGRRARLIELNPRYVDVTLHRFAKATGIAPLNLWTGDTLEISPPIRSRSSDAESALGGLHG
jgi:DNA modification methylase